MLEKQHVRTAHVQVGDFETPYNQKSSVANYFCIQFLGRSIQYLAALQQSSITKRRLGVKLGDRYCRFNAGEMLIKT